MGECANCNITLHDWRDCDLLSHNGNLLLGVRGASHPGNIEFSGHLLNVELRPLHFPRNKESDRNLGRRLHIYDICLDYSFGWVLPLEVYEGN